MSRKRVALTGVGLWCGLGSDPDSFVEGLLAGGSAIAPVTRFDTSSSSSHLAAELVDFDPARFIDPAKLRRVDDISSLAVAASHLALADGGFALTERNRGRTGVVLGSYTAGLEASAEYLEGLLLRGPMYVAPMIFSNTVGNAPASLCGIELELRGPNVSVNHKEASSFGAIAYAADLLRRGKADALLAGGVDRLTGLFYRVHDAFRAMSPGRGPGDEEGARPFDARRNGLVLGEGAYVVLLEEAASAEARGARIYAELAGVGAATARAARNAWPENEDGLVRAMRAALEDGACQSSDVGWVLASANGTEGLDRVEGRALAELFGPGGVPVASIKGAIGESSAGGAASLAAAALALGRGRVLPTAGFEEPAADCAAVDVASQARERDAACVLVNSFGTGGTSYSMLLRANRS